MASGCKIVRELSTKEAVPSLVADEVPADVVIEISGTVHASMTSVAESVKV